MNNENFFKKAESAFREIFSTAKNVDELHFAFSLSPEFRPYTVNTAIDAQNAFEEYVTFLKENEKSPIYVRIALAFYCHIAEASGFWEIPKNLLNIIDGKKYNPIPFFEFVKTYGGVEGSIGPNANKVMRSLMRYAQKVGFPELAEVFRDAFDSDLRNGFAHADYALLEKGICVGPRYKRERIIEWDEFNVLLNRAVNFYAIFKSVLIENLKYYSAARIVQGCLNHQEPEGTWEIHYGKDGFIVKGGIGYKPDQA